MRDAGSTAKRLYKLGRNTGVVFSFGGAARSLPVLVGL
jgi:hypothetical protein